MNHDQPRVTLECNSNLFGAETINVGFEEETSPRLGLRKVCS
jgi:hypothetical protein